MYEFLDKRYAQALYDVAVSKNRVEKYIGDLEAVVKIIEENPEFQNIIKHPEITTGEKKKFFINLFKGRLDEDLITFLLLLIEKDRILFLREKVEELKKIDLEHRNTLTAHVRVAVPLKDRQKAELKEKLRKKYGKDILIDEVVDPKVLGGIVIRVGDELMDASVRSRINTLKNSMISKIEVNI